MGNSRSWQAFAVSLAGLGLLMVLFPKAAPLLGAALVLGALFAAERDATAAGIAGPLAELGVVVRRPEPGK